MASDWPDALVMIAMRISYSTASDDDDDDDDDYNNNDDDDDDNMPTT